MRGFLQRYVNWGNMLEDARKWCEDNEPEGITPETIHDTMHGFIESLVEDLDNYGYEDVDEFLRTETAKDPDRVQLTIEVSAERYKDLQFGAKAQHMDEAKYATELVEGYVDMDIEALEDVVVEDDNEAE